MGTSDSRFDAGLLSLIGIRLLTFFLTLITIGLALPWSITIYQSWVTKHTIIDGRRLTFTGSGLGLFGAWVKIWLLTVITAGIYSFWAGLAIKKWVISHTHFETHAHAEPSAEVAVSGATTT